MVMGMTCQCTRLSVVQPRCRNNSNNSGHEPGKMVASDTTTTTEDDDRPAAPHWIARAPLPSTGHRAHTQAHEECADSDIGESTRDGRRWRTRTRPPEALATYDGLGRLHCLENTRDNARE